MGSWPFQLASEDTTRFAFTGQGVFFRVRLYTYEFAARSAIEDYPSRSR